MPFTDHGGMWYVRLYLSYALLCQISSISVNHVLLSSPETANSSEFRIL